MNKINIKRLFLKSLFVAIATILLFVNFSNANALSNTTAYDSRWVKVGDEWKVLNSDGTYLSNCWFFDTVQSRWYRIGASNDEVLTGATGHFNQKDSSSMLAGLWTEKSTNKSYFFDNFSSVTYGALIDTNGYYVINGQSIYLEFEQNDANTKGSITVGLAELKNSLIKNNQLLTPSANAGGSSGGGGGSGSGGGGGKDKPIAPKVKRTFLLYLIGSDLEEGELSSSKDLYNISNNNYDSDTRVLVFTGGARMELVEKAREKNENDNLKKVFSVNWDKNQIWEARNGISAVEEDFGSESMTDKNTLLKFLTYVKKYYPSEEYNIILNDHGCGAYGGLGIDTRPNITKKTPLSLIEFKEVFDKSISKFGFIGFDACLMANIEYLYGLSDYADYYIGSSEVECGSWDYSVFEELEKKPGISNEDFLKKIVDYYIGLKIIDSNTLALFNLKNFKNDIDSSLSAFAKNVYDLSLKDFDSLKELVQARAKSVDYGLIENMDYVDLKEMAISVFNSDLPNDTKTLISNLWDDVENHILYFKTNRPKDDSGEVKGNGVSMYFPLELVDMSNADDTLNKFYNSFGNIYNKDYNSMLRVIFTRMALAKKISTMTIVDDSEATKKLDKEVLNEGKKEIGLADSEIDKIKTNVYPDLLRYRLKNTTNSNFSFEKSGRHRELVFSYKKYLDTYYNEIYSKPIIYGDDGKELKLGHLTIPHTTIEEVDDMVWNITPKEGYWFKIKDSENESIASFYPMEIEDTDSVSDNYLFDKTITGYVPAIIEINNRGEEEYGVGDIEPILIYVVFEEMNNTASILGYTKYDVTDSYEPSKIIYQFIGDEIIRPVYNFEDEKFNKKVENYGERFKAITLQITRGAIDNKAVYYAYYVCDAFNQKVPLTINKNVMFKDVPNENKFLMPEYETWYNYEYKAADNSINMYSEIDGHNESISLIVSTVPKGNIIYRDFSSKERSFSDETINYFRQRDFDGIATSSIIISQTELKNLAAFSKAYLLTMETIKNIGGVDCAITKCYVVSVSFGTIYLFDTTISSDDTTSVINDNKMINYIIKMIENTNESSTADIEILVKPLVMNNAFTTSNSDLYENDESEIIVATMSEMDNKIATVSEMIESEEITSSIEETTIESTEQTSEEESFIESAESESEEESSSIESAEPTSEEESSSIESDESTNKEESSTIESTEQTSEEESTIESVEQTSEEESTLESIEPSSDAETITEKKNVD